MKSKGVFLAAILTAVLCISGNVFAATYGGGTGYSDNPYKIYTAEQLNTIGAESGDWASYFTLMNDIDMSGYTAATYNVIAPIYPYFTGNFEGNSHTIRNLPQCMFGSTYFGVISNLNLVNVASTLGGGLVASQMYGTISNCSCIGSATGYPASYTDKGGLVGSLYYGMISNCYTGGSVTSNVSCQRFGGLVGYVESGTVTNSHSSAVVSCGSSSVDVGGLVGYYKSGTITNCYATGAVTGAGNVGGFAGRVTSVISNCYSTGPVTVLTTGTFGGNYGGGFAGYMEPAASPTQPVISSCYSTGSVTAGNGAYNIGGFAGAVNFGLDPISGTISNCRSTGSVISGNSISRLGGLIGAMYYGIMNTCYSTSSVTSGSSCYWLGGLTGYLYSGIENDCYAFGNVTGGSSARYVGGLVGATDGGANAKIYRSFSTGQIIGTQDVGGLIGYRTAGDTISSCFWDTLTSGMPTSAGGKGKNTVDMQTQTTFTSAGWVFPATWSMNGYPALAWQPAIGVDGTLWTSLSLGQQGQIVFDIVSLTGESLNWTITPETCAWVTSITPTSGSVTGSTPATVTIALDTAGLTAGDYACQLTISADNGDTIKTPVTLNVFNRIDLEEFALLATHWGTMACVTGQPCKAVDWAIDGKIDIRDLELLAQNWLGSQLQTVLAEINDGFEAGNFAALNWSHAGQANWTMETSGTYEGAYCAKSGTIIDSQTSELILTCDTTGYGINAIRFARKVSSETDYDFLRFYIDGIEQGSWSGSSGWTLQTYTVTPGPHTFKWSYTKDSGDFGGADCCWIDNVRIFKQ